VEGEGVSRCLPIFSAIVVSVGCCWIFVGHLAATYRQSSLKLPAVPRLTAGALAIFAALLARSGIVGLFE
jgi:hypothetical protein